MTLILIKRIDVFKALIELNCSDLHKAGSIWCELYCTPAQLRTLDNINIAYKVLP